MWSLIPEKRMPPTRRVRYCCSIFKEKGCADRVIATGVRWAESTQRATRKEIETVTSKKSTSVGYNRKEETYEQLSFFEDESEIMLQNDNDARRKVIEHCQMKNKVAVNPIIGMTSQDVWEILRWRKVETNPLYQMGYDRVGCIGCPMAGKCQREKEFIDFPKYKDAYIRAFDRMLLVRKQLGLDGEDKTNWKDGYDVFDWWIENDDMEGQMKLADYYHEFMDNDW